MALLFRTRHNTECVSTQACSHVMDSSITGLWTQRISASFSFSFSSQFDSEYQFNNSVKTLLSHLPKQRYLKSICDELHHFKIMKKYVASQSCCIHGSVVVSWSARRYLRTRWCSRPSLPLYKRLYSGSYSWLCGHPPFLHPADFCFTFHENETRGQERNTFKEPFKKAGELLRAPAALNLGVSPRAPGVTVTVLQRELLGG